MKIIDAKLYRNSGKLLVPYDFCKTISHPTSGRTRKKLLLPVRVWIVVDMCSDHLLCARDLGSYSGFDRDKNEVWERDYMSQEKLSYFRRYPREQSSQFKYAVVHISIAFCSKPKPNLLLPLHFVDVMKSPNQIQLLPPNM